MVSPHRELIRDWLDGSLDDAGHERLQSLLRDRNTAREALVEVHFDDALRRVAKAQTDRLALEPTPALTPSANTTPTVRTRRHSSRNGRKFLRSRKIRSPRAKR